MADKPKLTRAERKQIEAVIRKYRGDGKPHTAQDTIPYQIMYPDGICYLGNRRYSQSIEFFDINYLLAQPDDQTAIFEYLCDLYNYLDSSIHVQFTYPNRKSNREQLARSFEMPPCNDGLDPIRQEQTDILKRQLARGNNGSVKTKYITYTIEADNLKAARARLSRISLDIQGYFKIMGAVSRVLDGKERLEVLHGIMHPDGERFNFDWKWLAAGGLSTKDFIAPSSFAFKNSRMFQMGGKLCAASFLQIITPELTDRILTDFLDTDSSLVVNVHIQALEQTEAVKMVKRKITDLDAMKIQEQKKAVRDGYDMDILPSDLATYGGAAKKLLQDLQSRNERYFLLTFLVLNYGDTKRKLENEVFRTAGVAQKHNCTLTRLDFQQERGLVSSLPLGENQIHITRGMTTSAVAIIVPFVTQELFQGGDSLYAGDSGSGLESCHPQPQHRRIDMVLRGRISFVIKRAANRSIQRGDLEAFQEMGRCADRCDAERQGSAVQPGNRKYSGKFRLHLYAQPSGGRPQNSCRTSEHLAGAAKVRHQLPTRRGTAVL